MICNHHIQFGTMITLITGKSYKVLTFQHINQLIKIRLILKSMSGNDMTYCCLLLKKVKLFTSAFLLVVYSCH